MHHADYPLSGLRILVTRPLEQADGLCRKISAAGGEPVSFPGVEIVFGAEGDSLSGRDLGGFDLIIFVSVNAVLGLERLADPAKWLPTGIAAIGPATARALKVRGLGVSLVPTAGFTSEALLETDFLRHTRGRSLLIVRGAGGRTRLAEVLRQRGASVHELRVYRRTPPREADRRVLEMLAGGQIHATMVTSGEILHNVLQLTSGLPDGLLKGLPLVAGGGRLATLARKAGFEDVVEASDPRDDAMLQALIERFNVTSAD